MKAEQATLRFFKHEQKSLFSKQTRWQVSATWKGNTYACAAIGFATQQEARDWMIQWLKNCQAHRLEEAIEKVTI